MAQKIGAFGSIVGALGSLIRHLGALGSTP